MIKRIIISNKPNRKNKQLLSAKKEIGRKRNHAETKYNVISEETTIIKNLKVALCAIAKMENRYISEWVDYYINLGFNHIYLYDNNEIDGEHFEEVLTEEQLKYITIIDYRNKQTGNNNVQIDAYNECYKKYGDLYDWIAFFDIDEFLTFTYDKTVQSYLSHNEFDNFKAIRINWMCYTDNNQLYYEDKPVQERFTEKTNARRNFIKSIFRTKIPDFIMNTEHSSACNIPNCDNNGNLILNNPYTLMFNNNYSAILRHYITKSTEEYIEIKNKRRLKGGQKDRLSMNFYFIFNKKTPEKVALFNKLLKNDK